MFLLLSIVVSFLLLSIIPSCRCSHLSKTLGLLPIFGGYESPAINMVFTGLV